MAADPKSMAAQLGGADRRLPFIVQFAGPVQQAWKQTVEQTGAHLGGYLPDNAFIVELTSDQLRHVTALEFVQWVGAYKPDYKIDPVLGRRIVGAQKASGPAALAEENFTIQTFSATTLPVVRDAVLNGRGQILATSSSGRRGLLRVRMSTAGVSALLDLPEVEFIEVYVAPQLHNNVATDSEHMNVQSLWTNANLTGAGQIVCVADTGLDTGDTNTIHPDFSNRIMAAFALGRPGDWSDSTANGGHGTHVAGSVLGSGAAWSNGLFRGAAYEAGLVFQSIMDSNGKLGGIPDELTNLFYQAYTQGARIHTDSWGSSVYGRYDSSSQGADQFMWDIKDMLVLFSAGNEGADAHSNGVIDASSVGSPGTAKNVLTVGAAESKRPAGSGGYSAYSWFNQWPNDYPANPIRDDLISTAFDTYQGMAAFSSRGPCIDGRFKPDIVAPGTDIVSCRSRMPGAGTEWGTGAGVLANAASNNYTFSGGTSMSTPLTAGAATLARQYLQQQRGFAAPSAALMKAALLNGARSLSPGQYGVGPYREIPGTRPNNVEGWGQVDLANTLLPSAGETNVYYDVTNPAYALVTGGARCYSFINSGAGRLSVTLCWSDYPASLAAAQQLVNDLDLTVTTPDGVVHYPNGLASADRLNNVEGVELSSTTPGTIQIRVSGYNVPNGPQPYALVIHGAGSVRAPAVKNDYDSDGKSDLAVYRNGYWSIFLLAGTMLCDNAGPWGGGSSIPAPGDYDGDRKSDLAFFRDGYWSVYLMAGRMLYDNAGVWGQAGCIPAPGDYDGDGKSDLALYRDGYWSIYTMAGNILYDNAGVWGGKGCLPAPGDYDGDGKSDLAFYRDGYWSIYTMAGNVLCDNAGPWGGADCIPVPGDFDGDGKSDLAFYRDGYWSIYTMAGNVLCDNAGPWGGKGCIPVSGDYDGDGRTDLAFYRNGYWSIYLMAGSVLYDNAGPWVGPNWVPVQ
jgi:subtilisin family serine protease